MQRASDTDGGLERMVKELRQIKNLLMLAALKSGATSDEVDYAWRFITSIHQGWASLPPPNFPNYYPFTDGPDEANRLLEGTQARWRSLAEM